MPPVQPVQYISLPVGYALSDEHGVCGYVLGTTVWSGKIFEIADIGKLMDSFGLFCGCGILSDCPAQVSYL